LPDVFRELVMQPIGASSTWEWHGYRNSYVDVDGVQMQSVSGGSHWGGGIFIHAQDQARIGLLMLNDGVWNGKRILSSEWIKRSRTPCDIFPGYGYFWWLNTGRKPNPPASESSYFAMGAGGNLTWIDPENDIVGVMRWMHPAARNGFIERAMAAIK
jgi:CubicO group peptidase (beta-lactamase class C family)